MADTIQRASSAPVRIETGPLSFGEDWPGVFIRGDEALALASELELYLEHKGLRLEDHPFVKGRVIDLLRSCDVRAKAA